MRALILRLLLLLLVVAVVLPVHAAPQPRPFAGQGILFLCPFVPERSAELAAVPLYREPGVGRIAEFTVHRLPQLTTYLTVPAGTYAVAAMEKRGNRLRIAYDDSGRAGWLERARWWDYLPWGEYLPGRTVTLLPGLKSGFYRICAGPSDGTPQQSPLPPRAPVWVTRVQDDWIQVTLPSATTGWLRWRDSDGRLLIAVGEQISPQNY